MRPAVAIACVLLAIVSLAGAARHTKGRERRGWVLALAGSVGALLPFVGSVTGIAMEIGILLKRVARRPPADARRRRRDGLPDRAAHAGGRAAARGRVRSRDARWHTAREEDDGRLGLYRASFLALAAAVEARDGYALCTVASRG